MEQQAKDTKDVQEVGHHLQKTAHAMAGAERDVFARSSYNRYYYACYLEARTALKEMSADWGRARHKSFPDIFRSSIPKILKAGRKVADRADDVELKKRIDQSLRACAELASIIERAYGTRIVADYNPEIGVGFNYSARFSLNGVEITDAHEWHGRVQLLASQILSTWRQVNA